MKERFQRVYLRAFLVWCGLLVLAIANGGLRESLLTPRFGPHAGHIMSTVTLCAAILVVVYLTIGWMEPMNSRDALVIGGMWVLLTVGFEFLAGHYLFGHPWSKLLADYNLLCGRIWVFVPTTLAFAPLVAARARSIFPINPT